MWLCVAIPTGSATCCEVIAEEMKKTLPEFTTTDAEDVLERACFAQTKVAGIPSLNKYFYLGVHAIVWN